MSSTPTDLPIADHPIADLPVADLPIASTANLPLPLGFAPAPLTRDEAAAPYDALLGRMVETVRPASLVEEIWVREIVDLVWEIVRLRRHKAWVLNSSAGEGMRQVLLDLDCRDAFDLAKAWFAQDPAAVAEAQARLAAAGLGVEAVMAQTLRLHLAEIEGVDRMLRSAEARRNTALHEIERHRASFAQVLRRAADAAERATVEDAEFAVVPTGQHLQAAG
jgi:hypothetical protein